MKKVISGVLTSLNTSILYEWDDWWEKEFSVGVPEECKPAIFDLVLEGELDKAAPNYHSRLMLRTAVTLFKARLYHQLITAYNDNPVYQPEEFNERVKLAYDESWWEGFRDEVQRCDGDAEDGCSVLTMHMLETFINQLIEIMTSEWAEKFYSAFYDELGNIMNGLQCVGVWLNEHMTRRLAEDPQCRLYVLETDDVKFIASKKWDESPEVVEWLDQQMSNATILPMLWVVNGVIVADMAHHTLNRGDVIKRYSIKPEVLNAINH